MVAYSRRSGKSRAVCFPQGEGSSAAATRGSGWCMGHLQLNWDWLQKKGSQWAQLSAFLWTRQHMLSLYRAWLGIQAFAQNTFSCTLFSCVGQLQPSPLGLREAVSLWDHTRRMVCGVPCTWTDTLQVTAPLCHPTPVGCFQLYNLPFTIWAPSWNADQQT